MKRILFALSLTMIILLSANHILAQNDNYPVKAPHFRENIPLDSIRLSDPAILADSTTNMYYMTGTGGLLWKSPDLRRWTGPYIIAQPDTNSWMGAHPQIWAAELHKYNGKYYYFATFTNDRLVSTEAFGTKIPRRASHILVSDSPEGPYRPVSNEDYLPADMPTLDGTFWIDSNGKPYMVYCHEWLHNHDGTIEKIELKPDLSGAIGEPQLMFKSSSCPWSEENDGSGRPNMVTDGPYLFRTESGRLGMIWTSWVRDIYTQGVVYSESGTLDGPWIHQKEPITPPDFGHGMLFRTLDGELLMSVHSHKDINGRYHRVPHLFHADLSGDTLRITEPY